MEMNTVIERLLNESKELESGFTSLHIETVKAEKTMTEALSRFTAGEISDEDLEKTRHDCKLIQKLKLEVGELLEVMWRLETMRIDYDNHSLNLF